MVTRTEKDRNDKWDWSTVVLIVLAVTVMLALTLELWATHQFGTQ